MFSEFRFCITTPIVMEKIGLRELAPPTRPRLLVIPACGPGTITGSPTRGTTYKRKSNRYTGDIGEQGL